MTLIHFDMETSDPDDCMTLAILATHPLARLVGVTSTPGGHEQYSLIRHVLRLMGREDVPVGVYDTERTKPCVSEFHYKWLGQVPTAIDEPPPTAQSVLTEVLNRWGTSITYLTGGPLKNYGNYKGRHFPQRWVGQGGFAGDNIVPEEDRLPNFAGKLTCETFNFNGDIRASQAIFHDRRINDRILVSKNVCHGVAWDRDFHDRVKALKRRTDGLELCCQGMDAYLRKHPSGKLLHDPLALAFALDSSIGWLSHVEAYREKGKWGSRWPERSDQANAWITTRVDQDRFFEVLTTV